ncbi:hypothetical protein [Roseomonas sp. WA12]
MIAPSNGFRFAALLAAGSLVVAGCAPVPVGPGPYQQQASNAAYACNQGIREACYDYQALAPAANAEAYQADQQAQQNAVVGTAVAAGLVGAVAGAAIAGSSSRGRSYNRGRYYHRGGYDRGYRRGYYR